MRNVTLTIACAGTLYMLIPWLITRIFGYGVFRKGEGNKEVAFTFDDGPNPEYTPELLDLLQRYGVKATFFVLGEKAAKYPELIGRMHREGHLIGVHNYTHISNWLLFPWKVSAHLKRSADQVEAITGVRPVYYRPPWGMVNLCDLILQRGYSLVLWSLMAHDWRSRVGKSRLKSSLLSRISDGSVVLLHDCGETFGANREAPFYMLRALDGVLGELREKGYNYVRIDEMIRPAEQPACAAADPKHSLNA